MCECLATLAPPGARSPPPVRSASGNHLATGGGLPTAEARAELRRQEFRPRPESTVAGPAMQRRGTKMYLEDFYVSKGVGELYA